MIDLTEPRLGGRRSPVVRRRGLLANSLIGVKMVLAFGDVAVLAVLALVLNHLSFGDALVLASRLSEPEGIGALALLSGVPLVWARLRLYRLSGGWCRSEAVTRGLIGAGALVFLIMGIVVMAKVEGVSRLWLASYGAGSALWIVVSRLSATRLLRRRTAAGRARRVLMVGGGIVAERFLHAVRNHPELGVEAIGFLGAGIPGDDSVPRLGSVEDLGDVLAREVVDEVVVCLPFEQWATIRACAELAEEQGKTIRIPLWMVEDLQSRSRVDRIGGVPLLSLARTPDDAGMMLVKRGIDLVGAGVGLLLTTPLMLLAALAIRLEDGGPVLFRQDRVGVHGRTFPLLKLRTMVTDAEDRLDEVIHLNERTEITFKAADDPRITRAGRLLRKTSLDEIPQFWNVLRGDMSLVGPRPALPREVHLYDPRHRRRLSVKPGITGLWQVMGRTESSFESWVAADLRYIDEWSPMTDVRIILKTVPAVLRGTGA